MTTRSVIGRAGVAPVCREPSLQSERVTELVLGETAVVHEVRGDWRRVQLEDDGYAGWLHAGYALEVDHEIARTWRNSAEGWSDGAVVRTDRAVVRLPLRARVGLAPPHVLLPDGSRGRIVAGVVAPLRKLARHHRTTPPDRWAARAFAGTPYQWGGVTPWGADCSGLVQTTFRALEINLPRDSTQQANCGRSVSRGNERPGDLLFFSDQPGSPRITHVALAGAGGTLVHSTLACGGFIEEPWEPGTRAAYLRERLVTIRRVRGED